MRFLITFWLCLPCLVPLSTRSEKVVYPDYYAIYSRDLMEFTWCSPLDINGYVRSGGSIYTGIPAGTHLTFNGPVTAHGTISSPAWAGHTTSQYQGPITYNGGTTTNSPDPGLGSLAEAHAIIDIPPPGEDPSNYPERLYYQAQVILLISNSSVTMIVQGGYQPATDTQKQILTLTTNPSVVRANFPFLTLTNTFTDQRENKLVMVTQIDIGLYGAWLGTNSAVLWKCPTNLGFYPTILYVADNRTTTGSQLAAVRITNGLAPPSNGGQGFTLATPNPLYVWGNYNQTNAALLNTTNTSQGTVPGALLCDALTVLSPNWKDSLSAGDFTIRYASNTTINAVIIAGLVYSNGAGASEYSGGIMNLVRLLENWGNGGATLLTLNTSLLNLFPSAQATTQFQNPGVYYYAPTRQINYDLNLLDPAWQPPGLPLPVLYENPTAFLLWPQISADGYMQFRVEAYPFFDFVVQASRDLLDWVSLATNTTPYTFQDPEPPTNTQRFYRAIPAP